MKKFLLALLLACGLAAPAHAMRSYITSDSQQYSALTPPLSDTVNNYALAANTAQTVTWPTNPNATYANITCPSTYWVSLQSGITVPSGTVTNGTGAALGAAQRKNGGEAAFYMISSTAQECSVEFFGGSQ